VFPPSGDSECTFQAPAGHRQDILRRCRQTPAAGGLALKRRQGRTQARACARALPTPTHLHYYHTTLTASLRAPMPAPFSPGLLRSHRAMRNMAGIWRGPGASYAHYHLRRASRHRPPQTDVHNSAGRKVRGTRACGPRAAGDKEGRVQALALAAGVGCPARGDRAWALRCSTPRRGSKTGAFHRWRPIFAYPPYRQPSRAVIIAMVGTSRASLFCWRITSRRPLPYAARYAC